MVDPIIEGLHDLRAVKAPKAVRQRALLGAGLADAYFPLDTPLGRLFIAHSRKGISAVLAASDGVEFEREFRAHTGRVAVPQAPPERLVQTLREWLRGDRRHKLEFDLDSLPEFQRLVLLKALEIPFGQIRPYSWIAREIGHPGAVRAVGTALGRNPIPLFIPCHRVVRSDGLLGNYSLIGPQAKRAVLASEGLEIERLEGLAKSGVRYFGSDSTHIFCFPTCRYAKTVTPRHHMTFGSESQARAAGYRPCKVCRPAA